MKSAYLLRATTVAVLLALALGACGSKDKDGEASSAEDGSAAGTLSLPGTKIVSVEISGQGYTREEAVDDALAMAVAQVNGKAFAGGNAGKVRGAIKDFKILSEEEVTRKIPDRKDVVDVQAKESSSGRYAAGGGAAGTASGRDGGSFAVAGSYSEEGSSEHDSSLKVTRSASGSERVWQVKVSANVIQYDAGTGGNRPWIVVALPRTSVDAFEIGDSRHPADEIAERIRRGLVDQLGQSNRYLVIDRSFTAEIDAELQNVMSESANPADVVRFGQRLTADILVVPVVEYFEYRKNVRKLKLSGRELISYAGGFKGSVAVMNVATGQLITNETFSVPFPTTEPRAFGPGVDAQGVADRIVRDWTAQFVGSLIRKTFPVTILSLEGSDAVLSQGGSLLKQGATYELVLMGKEILDPQTKQSLGRTERPIGTVTISRVDPNLSYGQVTLKRPLAAGEFRQGAIELRGEVDSPATGGGAAGPAESQPAASAEPAPAPASQQKRKKNEFDEFLEE